MLLLGLHCVSVAIDSTLKNDGATSLLPICVYMCVTQIGVRRFSGCCIPGDPLLTNLSYNNNNNRMSKVQSLSSV